MHVQTQMQLQIMEDTASLTQRDPDMDTDRDTDAGIC